jgi:hypothetical protein
MSVNNRECLEGNVNIVCTRNLNAYISHMPWVYNLVDLHA